MDASASTPSYARSVLAFATLKGVRWIYVEDQTHLKVGRIIITCDLFMAYVIALGSLISTDPWIEIILQGRVSENLHLKMIILSMLEVDP